MKFFLKNILITFKLTLFLISINLTQNVVGDGLILAFQWNQMDFYNRGANPQIESKGNIVFPQSIPSTPFYNKRNRRSHYSKTSRDDFVESNVRWNADNNNNANSSFIAYNNVPMGVCHFNGRLFVTMPRRRVGIPSTLNYIDLKKDGNNPSPKLRAYPNFETNTLKSGANANRIISVYRTAVDECDRLWFIDTGMLEYPNNRQQVQRPSIWIMDLDTDRVIRRFEIPESVVSTGRGLASITIDVNARRCNRAFAYLPDLLNGQLHVYSFENNRIWTFSHNYFKFDPLAGDLSIGGQNFRWDDGIFSVTLGPNKANNNRDVYFHAMASTNEFLVSNHILKNETNAGRDDHGRDFQLLGSRGANRQSTMHFYDTRTNVIFFCEIQLNGVGCWNTKKPFSTQNYGTVAQDERMIYPSDLTIDRDGTIWVLSNSMPIFIYSNLDPNVVNFRIWKQNVFAAARNTVCE